MPHPPIVVSAIVIRDDSGAILTVRKRGTSRFMFPGGKPELGETPAQTAIRECAEEIGADLDPTQLTFVGVFTSAAANEDGHMVQAAVFEHPLVPAVPAAEIAELRWIDPREPFRAEDVAPLLVDVLRSLDGLSDSP